MPPGAVWPAIVSLLLRISNRPCSLIAPPTSNTIVRGPVAERIACRRLPSIFGFVFVRVVVGKIGDVVNVAAAAADRRGALADGARKCDELRFCSDRGCNAADCDSYNSNCRRMRMSTEYSC